MDNESLQIIEARPGDVQQAQPGPILSALFGDFPVRILRFDDDFGVPLPDIAKGINYSLRSLHYMVARDKYFVPYRMNVTFMRRGPSGKQIPNKMIVLLEDGIMGLMFKIRASRAKDPAKEEVILGFQHWVAQLLKGLNRGTLSLSATDQHQNTGKPLVKNIDAIQKLAICPRYEHGHADEVKAIAEAEGKGVESIYRYIGLYRQADGLGLRYKPRKDRGKPRKSEEAEKVFQYLKEHPSDTIRDVWRNSGTAYSYHSVRRIIKNLRRGK